MKRILLFLMAMFAFGIQNVSAQDEPIKIVTNHPDFKVKVKRCAASGNTVIIDLVFNNVGTVDIEAIDVGGSNFGSTAYDDEGNYYEDMDVKIGNMSQYEASTPRFSIPTGVPVKVSVCINKVSVSAEIITRLKLTVFCDAWGLNSSRQVMISNIPISRD